MIIMFEDIKLYPKTSNKIATLRHLGQPI